MMNKKLIILATILAATFFAKPANADPILGGQLFYSGGDITITLVGGSASYHNILALYLLGDPNIINSSELLENHDAFDTSVTLSAAQMALLGYAVNDELVFGIAVYTGGSHTDPSNFSEVYVMGSGDRNPDEIMHAILDNDEGSDAYIVGFEDLLGGGDRDFNDTVFSFSGGVSNVVAEPGTLLLLGMGLLGVGLRRRMAVALP